MIFKDTVWFKDFLKNHKEIWNALHLLLFVWPVAFLTILASGSGSTSDDAPYLSGSFRRSSRNN